MMINISIFQAVVFLRVSLVAPPTVLPFFSCLLFSSSLRLVTPLEPAQVLRKPDDAKGGCWFLRGRWACPSIERQQRTVPGEGAGKVLYVSNQTELIYSSRYAPPPFYSTISFLGYRLYTRSIGLGGLSSLRAILARLRLWPRLGTTLLL